MQHLVRTVYVAIALVLLHVGHAAVAQAPVKQIRLSEKQVEGFIAAQKDMAALTEKMQGSASDRPDPKMQAELEAVAKRHGFGDFHEYDDVAANIALIMAGMDPQTKEFQEPPAAIKKEIEEIKADQTIPANEKKNMLDELAEALKVALPIQHAGNVDLVRKYFDRIEGVLR